jgi:hypothetical protein
MSILRRSVMGYYSYGHWVTVLRSAVYRTETPPPEDGKDQVCAAFSDLNSRMCTEFRHPVILAADISTLMCTTVTSCELTSSHCKLCSMFHFIMVRQPLIAASVF